MGVWEAQLSGVEKCGLVSGVSLPPKKEDASAIALGACIQTQGNSEVLDAHLSYTLLSARPPRPPPGPAPPPPPRACHPPPPHLQELTSQDLLGSY